LTTGDSCGLARMLLWETYSLTFSGICVASRFVNCSGSTH